jgi:hypothetical protein
MVQLLVRRIRQYNHFRNDAAQLPPDCCCGWAVAHRHDCSLNRSPRSQLQRSVATFREFHGVAGRLKGTRDPGTKFQLICNNQDTRSHEHFTAQSDSLPNSYILITISKRNCFSRWFNIWRDGLNLITGRHATNYQNTKTAPNADSTVTLL